LPLLLDLTGSVGVMNDDAMLILLQDLQTAVTNGEYSTAQTIRDTRLVHALGKFDRSRMKRSTEFSS
jgi:hypothetical protein